MLPELTVYLLSGLLAADGAPAVPEPADMEVLEFLGTFETQGGQWVDPLSLDERMAVIPKPPREEKPHE